MLPFSSTRGKRKRSGQVVERGFDDAQGGVEQGAGLCVHFGGEARGAVCGAEGDDARSPTSAGPQQGLSQHQNTAHVGVERSQQRGTKSGRTRSERTKNVD